MKSRLAKPLALLGAAAALILAVAPLERHGELSIPLHHALHAAIIAGGCALALALMRPADDGRERPGWLLPALAAPVVVMILMTPSFYLRLDQMPALHVGEHLALFAVGYAAVFSAQRYRTGTGWALGTLIVLMALTAAGGFGAYV